MKLKLQTVIACFLVIASFTAKSQTVSGYNDNDVLKLQAFFAITDGNLTNGQKNQQGAFAPLMPSGWAGITWDKSNPKRVISIVMQNMYAATKVNDLIGKLDISGFDSLKSVNVSYNSLSGISISGDTILTKLICSRNNIDTLDVTTNKALTYINCRSNNIVDLDFSKNIYLDTLMCGYNSTPNLNFTNNKDLIYLTCDGNNPGLTALDLTQNTNLKHLTCSSNSLTNLNLNNNAALQYLDCSINQLNPLDLTNNVNVDTLMCGENQITNIIGLSNDLALVYFDCYNNLLASINVAPNLALSYFAIDMNNLTSLDVSNNLNLSELTCEYNQIKKLDVTNNLKLKYLDCNDNLLDSLDLTKNTLLTHIYCMDNRLKFSDLKYNNLVTVATENPQFPFIPIGLDTAGGTIAAATGSTIDLTKETNINVVIGATANITTFHVWKKAWNDTISDVTSKCTFSGNGGSIQLPPTAGEYDSLFITMSNPSYSYFPEQTSTGLMALSSGMRTRMFRLVGSAFLPIELLSFTANLNNNKVDLAWSTASEKNNAFFTVERSVNNKDWENVAKINGAGNSNTQLNYSTIDKNPLSGVSYYRLKQTDFDGKFEYSKTVVINRNAKTAIQLYPNPAANEISVTGNEEELNSIKIYNSLGQDVTKYTNYSTSNTKQIMIDISKLTTGIYILKTKNTTNRLIVK